MSSSFENITRRLDITPATVDTTYDKSRSISRAIKKLPVSIAIPSVTGQNFQNHLVAQINCTMSSTFKIVDLNFDTPTTNQYELAVLCVRYRVGTTVVRYRLRYTDIIVDIETPGQPSVLAPWYNGEIIKPNFVLEVWSIFMGIGFPNNSSSYFLIPAFDLVTSRLQVPASVDDTTYMTYGTGTGVTRDELIQPVDPVEVLPTVYGDMSCWLTN